MQSTTHFVIGASLCRYTRWKPLGLILAFASHLALDAIPHFEDPSILPGRLAHWAGQCWGLLLAMDQVLVVGLALLTWLWFSRPSHGGRGFAAYLIAGGLLGAALDYLTTLMGPWSTAAQLNGWAHTAWFFPYIHAVREHPESRGPIAALCLAAELLVFSFGVWALLRASGRDEAAGGSPPRAETNPGKKNRQ